MDCFIYISDIFSIKNAIQGQTKDYKEKQCIQNDFFSAFPVLFSLLHYFLSFRCLLMNAIAS